MNLDQIVNHLTLPINGERVEMRDSLKLFSLHHMNTDPDNDKLLFLKELKKYALEEYIFDNKGSAIYFFKAGKSVIEIDISIEETIDIMPHICFNNEIVGEDLEQILWIDRFLYSFFKQVGLQN